jgi:hypothetical protein
MKRKGFVKITIILTAVIVAVVGFILIPSRPEKRILISSPTSELVGVGIGAFEWVSFQVTNTSNHRVFLQLAAIETKTNGQWKIDPNMHPMGFYGGIGRVEVGQTKKFVAEVAQGNGVSMRFRVLVSEDATGYQKAKFALQRRYSNLRYKTKFDKFWFDDLFCPAYELVTSETP